MISRSFAYQTVGVNVITIKEKRSPQKQTAASSFNVRDFPEQRLPAFRVPQPTILVVN